MYLLLRHKYQKDQGIMDKPSILHVNARLNETNVSLMSMSQ